MPVGSLNARSDRLLRQLRKVRSQFLCLVFRERGEVDSGHRTAACACAPTGVDRIALRARRHDEQDLAVGDDSSNLAESRQLVRIRPMNVLDDQELRSALHGRFDQLCECQRTAALPGRDLHRLFQGGELRVDRRVDEIAQEDDLIDGVAPRQRAPHGRGTLVRRRICAETEQAQRERSDRAPPGRLTEVEDLRRMHGDTALAGGAADCVDEACLTDAGFAAHDDRAPMAAIRASVQRRENHRELRPASDERLHAGADLAAQSLQAPREHGLGLTRL